MMLEPSSRFRTKTQRPVLRRCLHVYRALS